MATYSRVKTFVANETLTASDLNTEFNNIITNTNSGNLNSDNVSTSAAWTWTGYHTYSTSSRIVLADNIYMTLGNATDGDYRLRYNSSNTALELTSTNSDGSGTDAVVMDVQDGTDDVRIRGGFSTDNNTAPTSGIVTGGNIVSDTDSTDDLGTTSVRWANLYVDAATITNNLTVGGTLTLTGGLTLNGNVTVGDSASDTLTINSTITSNLLFTDATYDIGASGATRPRDLFLSRNAVMGGTLGVTGLITASGGVSGALTGNVTGNLTGNVTGNVTGNLTGDVTGNISGNVTGGTISGTTGSFSSTLGVTGATTLSSDVGIGVAAGSALTSTGTTLTIKEDDNTNSANIEMIGGNASGEVAGRIKASYTNNITSQEIRFSLGPNGADNGETIFFTRGPDGFLERFKVGQGTVSVTGDLAVDTDTLFVDTSADRVGINTASPTASLTVAGPNTATNMGGNNALTIMDGNADNEFVTLKFQTSAGGNLAAIGAKATTTGAYPNSVGELHFATQSGSVRYNAMVIDSSQRVGIGTVSPTAALHVSKAGTQMPIANFQGNEDVSVKIESTFTSSSGAGIFLEFDDAFTSTTDAFQIGVPISGTNFAIGYGTQDDFRLTDSILTATTTGNVGIGTSSPSALAHVYNGTLQVGSKTGDGGIQQNTDAIRIAALPNSSTEWGGLQWYREFSDYIGAEIIAARPSTNESETDLIFKTSGTAANATERARILSSGGITFNGDTSSNNALSDYEIGTYSVTDQSGAGVTFTTISNKYTKIGRLVFFALEINSISATGTAQFKLSLPFTALAGSGRYTLNAVTNSTNANLSGYIVGGTSNFTLIESDTSPTTITNASMNGYYLVLTGCYEAA